MKLALAILLCVNGASAMARRPPVQSALQKAAHFSMGPVGFAGETSEEEFAFRAALKATEARDIFSSLASSATPAGQMYGLLGLMLLNDPRFEARASDLASDKEAVPMMVGCVIYQQTKAEVIDLIRSGHYK